MPWNPYYDGLDAPMKDQETLGTRLFETVAIIAMFTFMVWFL